MKTLFEIYEDILKENNRWNPTKNPNIEHAFPDILTSPFPCAYNFIFEMFFWDGNIHTLSFNLHKYRKSIPEERLTHTVSLYLLGIQIAETIGFNQFNLPIWDDCLQRNFLHHWAAICLYHDIGYCIEEDEKEFNPENNQTLDIISNNLGLKYNLRSKDTTSIMDRYYRYRIAKPKPVIDHGIIGAMMLYDSLMKRNDKMKETAKDAIMMYEKPMFGEVNETNILKYSFNIARHNMWLVSKPEDIEKYKSSEVELDDLIVRPDGSNKISFKNEPMLFLLCLVDTIDPIKAYSENEPKDIAQKVNYACERENDQLKIIFVDGIGERINNKIHECNDWLNVFAQTNESSCGSISFQIN